MLIAFGDVEDANLTPFTAAEAEIAEDIWDGWTPVRKALQCIEMVAAATKAQQSTVTPKTDEPIGDPRIEYRVYH